VISLKARENDDNDGPIAEIHAGRSLLGERVLAERANFRESARIRFLAGARRRLIGGEVRGIPSHSHVDDHRRRGGRLLSYDFFEDDSRSMFHELAPERVKATTKRKPRSIVSPLSLTGEN